MSKNLFKLTACLLAVCLTAFCACSKQSDDTGTGEQLSGKSVGSIYDTHLDITLSHWLIGEAFKTKDTDEVLRKVEDMFNVTLIPVDVTWDNYYNQVDLWAEKGEFPDVFSTAVRGKEQMFDWVHAGLLKQIPSDLSKYPNLAGYMESPEKAGCLVDDKIYCIFRQTYSEQAETIKDRTILYRWDLAQQAGITTEPSNWDEFRSMILAITKADPEHKNIEGMTGKGYGMLIGPLFTYSIPLASTGGASFYWVESPNGYVPALFAGDTFGADALPTWHLIRDMYTEGTIVKDIAFTSVTQAVGRFVNGETAAVCIDASLGNSKTCEQIITPWEEKYGKPFTENVKVLDIMPSVDGESYYNVWGYAWSESYISSSVSDEKLDRILAIFDYLLSEEGTILSNFGIEGETYIYDTQGKIKLIGEPANEKYPSTKILPFLVCWNYGIVDGKDFPSNIKEEYLKIDEARVEKARKCAIPSYSTECSAVYNELHSDFSIDTDDIFIKIMTDPRPVEEVWAEIIDEYRQSGLMELIGLVNEKAGY